MIKTPVTPDGLAGFDQFNQFVVGWVESSGTSYTFLPDVRKATCPLCKRGWELTSAALLNQATLSNGKQTHKTCLEGFHTLTEYMFWNNLLSERLISDRQGYSIEESLNEYEGNNHVPWYTLKLTRYPDVVFTVGWRKRVINIRVENIGQEQTKRLEQAFELEETTKEAFWAKDGKSRGYTIHAWGNDKARQYMHTIVDILAPVAVPTVF